jgi:hypothetical protein
MPKYPTIQENEETGWSDWLKPLMSGYKMACCDCGLVHELQFQVLKQKKLVKEYKDGNHVFSYEEVENPKYHVGLRARRNNRATAQKRRHNQLKT